MSVCAKCGHEIHQQAFCDNCGLSSKLTTPYTPTKRATYGVLWAFWTVVLVMAGFNSILHNFLSGLVLLVLAAFAGRYDYRIWTYQARRLLFFIIF